MPIIAIGSEQVLLDAEDFSKVFMQSLHIHVAKTGKKYVYNSKGIFINSVKYIYLARAVLEYSGELEVDHINGNTLDNRKENLRVVSKERNLRNSSIRSDNVSGQVGVGIHKPSQKYYAQINHNKKTVWLGLFDTYEGAVAKRKQAEIAFGYDRNHGRSK